MTIVGTFRIRKMPLAETWQKRALDKKLARWVDRWMNWQARQLLGYGN